MAKCRLVTLEVPQSANVIPDATSCISPVKPKLWNNSQKILLECLWNFWQLKKTQFVYLKHTKTYKRVKINVKEILLTSMTQLVLQGQSGLTVQHSVEQLTRQTIQYNITKASTTCSSLCCRYQVFFDAMQKFFVYFSLFGKLDCNLPALTL